MEITVKIPKHMIETVACEIKAQTGREPTRQQLERFFRKDILWMYLEAFEDGLADSVLAHFG